MYRFSHKEFRFSFPPPTAPLSEVKNVYRVGVYSCPVKRFTKMRIFVIFYSRYKNYCKSVEKLFLFNRTKIFYRTTINGFLTSIISPLKTQLSKSITFTSTKSPTCTSATIGKNTSLKFLVLPKNISSFFPEISTS